jgi:hypothetical protein
MRFKWTITVIAAAMLVACGSVEGAWDKANAENSVQAYQAFLDKYPADKHADEARAKIAALQDLQAWTAADTANTEAAFQGYLQKHGSGVHAQEARDRLNGLQGAVAWQQAIQTGTAAAFKDFLHKYPIGPQTAAAKAKLAELAGYRVRLATASTLSAATGQRDRLERYYGKTLTEVDVLEPTPTEKSFAVVSGDMTEDQANAACATLKRSHQRCEVEKASDI